MKTRRSTISLILTLFTLFLGTLVIVGWWISDDFLRSIVPGQVKMKVNVALGFVFSSIVLLLNYSPVRRKANQVISVGLCFVVIMIGLLTQVEYAFGINPGIDELFFRDELPTTPTYFAGRMSPLSAINFILIGSGLLLLNKEGTARYQYFYLFAIAFVAVLMLIGFNFISDIPTFIRLAIHVSIGFITLPAAIYFAQPVFETRISFETKLITGFVAAILLILIIGVFSFYYNQKRTQANQLVEHTKTVMYEVERTLSLVKDIEADGRGYLIPGDSTYLQYFDTAVGRASRQIDKILELTKANSWLQIRIDSFSALIDKRVWYLNRPK